jgi:uncharacterized protein YbjT (DUF2867 family)
VVGPASSLGSELSWWAGDLLDDGSLLGAMTGTAVVYAVTTPFTDGPESELEQGEQIIAAAGRTEVPWLILASVASADRATGIPHFESKWRIEQQLRSSRLPHTVVAPTYFYENLGDPAQVIAGGELTLPLPASRPLQQVALANLGGLVAALLARGQEFLGERIEVAGDQPTPQQMADALSVAGGRPVRYGRIGLEQVAARSANWRPCTAFLSRPVIRSISTLYAAAFQRWTGRASRHGRSKAQRRELGACDRALLDEGFVVGTTWAPSVAREPRVMPTTPRGVSYFAPSLFVITVLAALALRMSVTRLALACCAAAPSWVAAAAAIAVRSASTRLAAPVTVLKLAARFERGFSVWSWLSWFCQRVARLWNVAAI